MFSLFVLAVVFTFVLPSLSSSPQHFKHFKVRQSGGVSPASDPLSPENIPPPCLPLCTGIIDKTKTCKNKACICTDANFQLLRTCVDCVTFYEDSGAQAVMKAQSDADRLVQQCNSAGFQISCITIIPTPPVTTPCNSSSVGPTGVTTLNSDTTSSSSPSSSSLIPSSLPTSVQSPSSLLSSPTPTATGTLLALSSPSATSGGYSMYAKKNVAAALGVAALAITVCTL